MANIPESESYDSGIYQLEIVDEVLGGVNGKANSQAKGLANRTKWLKAQVDALNLLKGKGVASFSIANSYVAGEIVDYQKNIYRANTTVTTGAWNAGQWDMLLGTVAESEWATATPLMAGTAAVGTAVKAAREDHRHPADTGREAAIAAGTTSQFWRGDKSWQDLAAAVRASVLTGLSTASSAVVAAADTILVAIGKLQAQISLRALIDSPTFTGNPAAPTAAADTNTTQVATTAYVVGQASALSPVMNGSAAIGTSLKFARADHVHPIDTSRAPLASPTFTGTPAAPTAAAGTNTTQLATTAFVLANAPGGVGVGQTWQNVLASRVLGTTYTNSTGKPIMISITTDADNGTGQALGITVAGVLIVDDRSTAGVSLTSTVIVPVGATYSATSNRTLRLWAELR